jgi:hypothetical protein
MPGESVPRNFLELQSYQTHAVISMRLLGKCEANSVSLTAFLFAYSGGWSPLGTAAIYCPIVPAPGDCEDGELFSGMKIDKGNRSTRRKPAPAPLCPPQIPLDQNRD